METIKFVITVAIWVALTLPNSCRGQQTTSIFNQQFQRRQQSGQILQPFQQPQQQQLFPNTLGSLNPITPLGGFNPVSQLGPQAGGAYRPYSPLAGQNYVPITAYQNDLNPFDGSFSYGYAAGDGTTAQAQGYVKNLGLGEAVEAQVVQGSYSYTSPEGTPITVRYIADENGFRAEGAHIPASPPLAFVPPTAYQGALMPNLNPYQTPYRQFVTNQEGPRPGQQQLTPQQLQQQQRLLQQQQQQQLQNTGQYQPDRQFGSQQTAGGFFGARGGPIGIGGGPLQGQFPGQFGGVGNFGVGGFGVGRPAFDQQQNQQNLTLQQQQNLQQQQQQQQQQAQQNQQQQNIQQQQQQNAQQQQLSTQELRGRPNQLVNAFGYNQYRRYKKATTKT